MQELRFIFRVTEQGVITSERIFTMKTWHWGCIIIAVAAYLLGVKFPATGQTLLSKVGLA